MNPSWCRFHLEEIPRRQEIFKFISSGPGEFTPLFTVRNLVKLLFHWSCSSDLSSSFTLGIVPPPHPSKKSCSPPAPPPVLLSSQGTRKEEHLLVPPLDSFLPGIIEHAYTPTPDRFPIHRLSKNSSRRSFRATYSSGQDSGVSQSPFPFTTPAANWFCPPLPPSSSGP